MDELITDFQQRISMLKRMLRINLWGSLAAILASCLIILFGGILEGLGIISIWALCQAALFLWYTSAVWDIGIDLHDFYSSMNLISDLDVLTGLLFSCSFPGKPMYWLYKHMRSILKNPDEAPSVELDPQSSPAILSLLSYDPFDSHDTAAISFWKLQVLWLLLKYRGRWMGDAWKPHLESCAAAGRKKGRITAALTAFYLGEKQAMPASATRSHLQRVFLWRAYAVICLNCLCYALLVFAGAYVIFFVPGWRDRWLGVCGTDLAVMLCLFLFLSAASYSSCLNITVKLTWLNSLEHINLCTVLMLVSPPYCISSPELPFTLLLLIRSFAASNPSGSGKRPWLLRVKPERWLFAFIGLHNCFSRKINPQVRNSYTIYQEFIADYKEFAVEMPLRDIGALRS